ncbi:MAG TPA: aminotransferase class I/II-fold pyridoxal phosphate-dependent enzyme [Acidimicrobiales bacterium]|nr:aminotransferase class I/II-fold pyridoxal phosphate-dependent enzyme [Acidimicrobiales bacterium]
MIPASGAHGGDGPAIARALGIDPDRIVDLSLSLNPFAPAIDDLARRHVHVLRNYPDVDGASDLLADALEVERDRLVLTNGGSEAIVLVARELGGSVVAEPEFSLHPRGAGAPRWRSNPHNPTGVLAGASDTADVWDEAFYPLATGTWTRGDRGVVVVGSLTKVFACPGLRLGYVLADDAARFARSQPAWPVNALALALLPDLLARADLPGWCRAIQVRRSELVELLRSRGYEPGASDAPWLLVEAPGLRERLAPCGVVVRDCTSFGLPGHVRIAVPDDAGLARLHEVLPCAKETP